MSSKSVLAGSAALLALAATGTASAQEQQQSEEEIVVTAQRREQALIDVPLSVSAYSGDTLADAGVENLQELQRVSPNLLVQRYSNALASAVVIRGIGTATADPGFEPSVATSIDGVYRGFGGSAFNDLGDLERIEVLRGPQSALWGKNAAIGAVNIISRAPSYEWDANASASYGNYDLRTLRLAFGGPIVDDRIAFRLALSHRARDGYLDNISGPDVNAIEHTSARGQLLFDFDPNTSLRVIGDYTRHDDTAYNPVFLFVNTRTTCEANPPAGRGTGDMWVAAFPVFFCNGTPNPGPFVGVTIPGFAQGTPGMFGNEPGVFLDPSDRRVALTIPNSERLEEAGLSLEFVRDFGDLTFTTLLSHREVDHPLIFNLGFNIGSAATRAPAIAHEDDNITEEQAEFRLNNAAADEPGHIDWTLGLLYYRQSADVTGNFEQAGVTVFRTSDNDYEDTVGSVYGQATWHATDRLNVNIAARYLNEQKEITYAGVFTLFPPPTFSPTTIAHSTHWETGDDLVTGSIELQYELGDMGNVYVRAAHGAKSPGMNMAGTPTGLEPRATNFSTITGCGADNICLPGEGTYALISPIFAAESIDSYEIGARLSLLDRRLHVNGAIFFQELQDQQLQSIRPGDLNPFVLNAAQIETQGFELDYDWTANDYLSFSGGLVYLDSEYVSFPNAPPRLNSRPPAPASLDLTGQRPYQTPEWLVTGDVQLRLPLGPAHDLTGRVGYRYVSEYSPDTSQHAEFINEATTYYDASLTFSGDQLPWSLQLWGRNLTDEVTYQAGQAVPTTHSAYVYLNEPVTYGMTLNYQF